MKNKFSRLSESRKMELYQVNIEDAYNAGYANGFEAGYETGAHNERTGVCDGPVVKSPNQRRAELIQRAREFVEEHTRLDVGLNNGTVCMMHGKWFIIPDFVVNNEKRTVACLLKGGHSGDVIFRDKAKCRLYRY